MTLYELLEQSAQKNPDRPAIHFKDKTWTYRALLDGVSQTASGFRSAGIRPGDKVALLLKNCPEFIFSVFALNRIGAVAVPMNFLLKPEEIRFICSDSGARAAVTQTAFLETLEEARQKISGFGPVWVADGGGDRDFSGFAAAGTTPADAAARDPEAAALILYTSGTSGKSKGAVLSNRNLAANTDACIEALELTQKDRFLCLLPMFHVFAWTTCVLIPLRLGTQIAIVESIRPPKPWLRLLSRHKITVFAAIPQIYLHLAEQARGLKKWVLRFFFFRSVRFCISGAAPLSLEILEKFETGVGKPLLEGYGLTETSPVVSANSLRARKNGSVGRAFPGVEIKIAGESGQSLPAEQEGEIWVRGPSVTAGYLNRPEENEKAFSPDGWFKTGDVGALDADGFLFIRDRIKDMIIIKGLKVYSVQVEDVLLAHPAVQEAAVVGIPNASGDETVKAFVVLKEGAAADRLELLKFCAEKLPPYKRPKDIEIRKELPKNALQKVLKRELRKGT